MKIGFGKLNAQARLPEIWSAGVALVTPIPLELQGGERVELRTGLSVRVPEGYVLSIRSLPSILVRKGLEVIPSLVVPEDEDELVLLLYNTGRSQVNLQPGMQVGMAILQTTADIEVEEFTPEKQKVGRPQRKTPKKDPFRFEVS